MSAVRLRFFAGLLLVLALLLSLRRSPEPSPDGKAVAAGPSAATPSLPQEPTDLTKAGGDVSAAPLTAAQGSAGEPGPVAAFEEWLTAWRRAAPEDESGLTSTGVELARRRRVALRELIRQDPEAALAAAVPAGFRATLPPAVVAELEERIDRRGDWEVAVSCLGGVTRLERFAVIGGRRLEAFTHGRRIEQHTKLVIPLHGIAIDGLGAFTDEPLRLLDEVEKSVLGLPSDENVASIGGEIAMFDGPEDLAQRRSSLLAAEATVGPFVAATNSPARAASTPWILGAKRVLWVQVDFADDPGAVATVAEIEATNRQVAAFIAATSHGATTMTFTVLPSMSRLARRRSAWMRPKRSGPMP